MHYIVAALASFSFGLQFRSTPKAVLCDWSFHYSASICWGELPCVAEWTRRTGVSVFDVLIRGKIWARDFDMAGVRIRMLVLFENIYLAYRGSPV